MKLYGEIYHFFKKDKLEKQENYNLKRKAKFL